jgi:serine/threonine protein kinase/WD40 repeat protein
MMDRRKLAMNERELFEAVLDYPSAERSRYLDGACGGDPDLRSRVEALLKRHDEAGSFLEKPILAGDQTSLYPPLNEGTGTLIGPFKLLQKIGEGGFGVVYMAEQQKPVRRIVALKIIKPGMDSAQVIARFESERQALALMDHPNIAKVLDAGATESGHPYFVMELVKGIPITDFCDKNHLIAADRLKLFIDVCHAIQHAHHKGVIHRDIKPSNVLVTLHDGVPVVKVIDFGVAKATLQKLTERTLFTAFGQMVGTPAYMSPEQAEMSGLDIDTRSDVYSLGVLLYELLTGTTPLEVKQLQEAGYLEMQRLIRDEPAPRPSTRLSSMGNSATVLAGNRGLDVRRLVQLLAGDLDWIVMKSLDKDRNRRYGTPGNFAEDIQRYLQREAILARPPSTAYKLKMFTRRNRATVITGGTISLMLLLGIAGTTFGLFRAEQRRAEVEQARAEELKQRERVTEEQARTQEALGKAQTSEAKALVAERAALHQAANSGCDVAQQLCERNSVSQGLIEYGSALKFAHEAQDAELEEAIRWNIGTWQNQMHALTFEIKASGKFYPAAAIHPKGKILAVGQQTGTKDGVIVRLHDADNGTPREENLIVLGPERVYRMAWQPDGERLGIYTGDGRIHIWKPGINSPEVSIDADVGGKYFDDVTFPRLAFCPDGSRLIAGASQAFSTVFDTTTGKPADAQPQYGELKPGDRWEAAVDWSRDGKLLVTGNLQGIARIGNAATGEIVREFRAAPRGISAIKFSPDGKQVACAAGYGLPVLQVWEAATGKPVGPPMVHYDNPYDVDFSPDGKCVVAVDSSCEAFIWEVGSSRCMGAPIWTGAHTTTAMYHPDGKRVLTVQSQLVRVWTLGTLMPKSDAVYVDPEVTRLAPIAAKYNVDLQPGFQNNGVTTSAREIALSPDGNCLLRFDRTKTGLDMIDAKTLQLVRKIQGDSSTVAAYWKPDSKEFVQAGYWNPRIRDGVTGAAKAQLSFRVIPECASFSPDGTRFAIATSDYHLRFFDTTTWKPVGPTLRHTGSVKGCTYSPDGKLVFTDDTALTTRIWHAATGKRIGPVLSGYWPRVCADKASFVIQQEGKPVAYFIPVPANGDIADVVHQIKSLTGQVGVIDPLGD